MDYLVVGLGNPGSEYENTPHNLGFMVVDKLAETHAIRVRRKENLSKVGLGVIGLKRGAGQAADVYESERAGGERSVGAVRINAGSLDSGI